MEEVKRLNKEFAHEGVVYGETSRSDILDEEKKVGAVRPIAPSGMKEKRGIDSNTFPQPLLCKNHTEANVCFYSHHIESPLIHHQCFFFVG